VFVRLPVYRVGARTVPIRNIFERDEITMGNMFFEKFVVRLEIIILFPFRRIYNFVLTYMRAFVTLLDCILWYMVSTRHGVNIYSDVRNIIVNLQPTVVVV